MVAHAVGRLSQIFIDANDPETVAEFWSRALGVGIERRDPPYVLLEPLPSGLVVGVQRVPEPKAGKARVHVDLTVDDLEPAVTRVQALGGQFVAGPFEGIHRWVVLSDPEGTEFCAVTMANRAPGT